MSFRNELELQVSWVVPVKIEELGAHIQAYHDVLPIQAAFKLCVLHSSGSMSMLPLEIIDHILEDVTEAERREHSRLWTARYSNAVREHAELSLDYIKDALLKRHHRSTDTWLRSIIEGFAQECELCSGTRADSMSLIAMCSDCTACLDFNNPMTWCDHPKAEQLAEYIYYDDDGPWCHEKLDQAVNWQHQHRHNEILCPEWLLLLREHFAVDVWIRPMPEDADEHIWGQTTALLILASTESSSESASYRVDPDEQEKGAIAACMAIVKHQGLKPEQQATIRRALHKLKLTPCPALVRCEESTSNPGPPQEWPQLVSLARVRHC